MLGERPVDMCHWESFGKGWLGDVANHLKLEHVTEITAGYGDLPDLSKTNKVRPTSPPVEEGCHASLLLSLPLSAFPCLCGRQDHDIVFTWNGTTSGVCVPNADWIAADRTGLTFNDATSAVFAMEIDWAKVDVTTFSWQKVRVPSFGAGRQGSPNVPSGVKRPRLTQYAAR